MKLVWVIFAGLVMAEVLDFPGIVFFGLSALLLVVHIVNSLGWKRGGLLVCLAMLIGWIAEVEGLRSGTIFGGRYVYRMASGWSILSVPLPVILYWGIFIYSGFFVTKAVLRGRGGILKTALVNAGVVTAIDLFMDPIAVAKGKWTWLDGGEYFGIPWGNFVGWFAVAFVTTVIYELLTQKWADKFLSDKEVYLPPIVGYFTLWLSFVITSLKLGMRELTVMGTVAMLPVIMTSLWGWRLVRTLGKNQK